AVRPWATSDRNVLLLLQMYNCPTPVKRNTQHVCCLLASIHPCLSTGNSIEYPKPWKSQYLYIVFQSCKHPAEFQYHQCPDKKCDHHNEVTGSKHSGHCFPCL